MAQLAEEVGRLLAEAGVAVVCGGTRGVMEAACARRGRGGRHGDRDRPRHLGRGSEPVLHPRRRDRHRPGPQPRGRRLRRGRNRRRRRVGDAVGDRLVLSHPEGGQTADGARRPELAQGEDREGVGPGERGGRARDAGAASTRSGSAPAGVAARRRSASRRSAARRSARRWHALGAAGERARLQALQAVGAVQGSVPGQPLAGRDAEARPLGGQAQQGPPHGREERRQRKRPHRPGRRRVESRPRVPARRTSAPRSRTPPRSRRRRWADFVHIVRIRPIGGRFGAGGGDGVGEVVAGVALLVVGAVAPGEGRGWRAGGRRRGRRRRPSRRRRPGPRVPRPARRRRRSGPRRRGRGRAGSGRRGAPRGGSRRRRRRARRSPASRGQT